MYLYSSIPSCQCISILSFLSDNILKIKEKSDQIVVRKPRKQCAQQEQQQRNKSKEYS